MNWLEITINPPAGEAEAVAQALTAGGFSEFLLEDQEEFETFLQENKAYWDYIDEGFQNRLQGLSRIRLYLEEDDQAELTRLTALLDALGLKAQVAALPEENWEESWKDSYPPQPVGRNLLVLPYWLADTCPEDKLPVILDPGLTFGTGAHPSTQMVMEAMEEGVRPGDACLDLGSGSGILSITALRLGAKSAIGVDIDPKAEDIARENAAYNGFSAPAFTALTGNVTADTALMERLAAGSYRVVLVNIVADVIIALAPVLPRFLQTDTRLICSGILSERLPEVVAALEQAGLTVLQTRAKEEWRCVIAGRRPL